MKDLILGVLIGIITFVASNRILAYFEKNHKMRKYIKAVCKELRTLKASLASLSETFDGEYMLETPIWNVLQSSEYICDFAIYKDGYSACFTIYSNLTSIKKMQKEYKTNPSNTLKGEICKEGAKTVTAINIFLQRYNKA